MSARGTGPVISLVTCRAMPDGDEDGPRLLAALAARGIEAEWTVWDDPAAEWERFELAVIRSTWDYTFDRPGFLTWAADRSARSAGSTLHNDAAVIAWNSDKTYLRDLAVSGLASPPSGSSRAHRATFPRPSSC